MGRNYTSEKLSRLAVRPPPISMFRCPISLEVMRSPVSLCTGVTYDRASIQRWLDSGNTTCPATNLPLPTTDLTPNLTLRHLIATWSSSFPPLQPISSSAEPLPLIHQLSVFFSDPDVDDALKNSLINAGDFPAVAVSVLADTGDVRVVEAMVGVVGLVLDSECIEDRNKEAVISAVTTSSGFNVCISSLISVLKDSTDMESRISSARVLRAILSSPLLSSSSESDFMSPLIQELARLISIGSARAIGEGLGCMVGLVHSKIAIKTMVKSGAVPLLVRILSSDTNQETPPRAILEKVILILDAIASCRMGRAAIGEVLEECVEGVVRRMMKAGGGGREAAVGVLWSVCYCSWSEDENLRGRKAVVGARGGAMAKILVVMQGECSPAVRRMAGDLLRVFRGVEGKRLMVAGYDTKTTHIRPF